MNVAKFNSLKTKIVSDQSKEEIIKFFKECSIPYPGYMFTFLKEQGCINETSKWRYRFQSEPILERVFEAGREKAKNYTKKYQNKEVSNNNPYPMNSSEFKLFEDLTKQKKALQATKTVEPVKVSKVSTFEKDAEQEAVDFLKQRGYKIFKYVEI